MIKVIIINKTIRPWDFVYYHLFIYSSSFNYHNHYSFFYWTCLIFIIINIGYILRLTWCQEGLAVLQLFLRQPDWYQQRRQHPIRSCESSWCHQKVAAGVHCCCRRCQWCQRWCECPRSHPWRCWSPRLTHPGPHPCFVKEFRYKSTIDGICVFFFFFIKNSDAHIQMMISSWAKAKRMRSPWKDKTWYASRIDMHADQDYHLRR